MKRNLFPAGVLFVIAVFAGNVNAQTSRASANAAEPLVQQPLYSDYKGVRLGMIADEVRAKLGNPVLKDAELDYYVFSDKETAQIAYDANHKAKIISVDYAGGVGAPNFKNVVGASLDTRPDGSQYKVVRYVALGFWVSYNQTAGPVTIVTITIQQIDR
jgi:outer membrane protein assembly factor BamE (lipoprotein component of BamABCDE complex)